jgi:iron complex outermembrane receptor protein
MKWWEAVEHPSFSGLNFSHAKRYNNLDVVLGGNYYNNFSYLWKGDELRFRANFKTRYRHPKKEGLMYGINGNVMYENSGRFFLAQDALDNAYRRMDGSNDDYIRFSIDPHWTYVKENGDNHKLRARYLNVTRLPSDNARAFNSNLFMLDYQYQKKFNDNWRLVSGVPIHAGIAKSNLYTGWKATGSGAVYSQIEFNKDKWSIMGGGRYEFSAIDKIYSTALPVFRTGMNYKLGARTSVRASLGQAYRLPSIGERFISAGFSGLKIVPNPDLVAETGWGSELGLKHRVDFGDFSAFLDGAFFLNEYKNFVEYTLGLYPEEGQTATFDDLGLKPLNTADSRVAGYELSMFAKGNISEIVNINALIGYSYNYPADLGGDSTQRALGEYFSNFFYAMFNRMEDYEDSNGEWVDMESKILSFRTRHIIKVDIELEWRKFRMGYNLNFFSFPEKIPMLYEQAVPYLGTYIDNNGYADILHSLRCAYRFNDSFTLSFVAKNITNDEYFKRIGLMDAPQNYTVKFVFNL